MNVTLEIESGAVAQMVNFTVETNRDGEIVATEAYDMAFEDGQWVETEWLDDDFANDLLISACGWNNCRAMTTAAQTENNRLVEIAVGW